MKTSLLIKAMLVVPVLLSPMFSNAQNLLNGPQKIVIDVPRNRLLVSNFNTGDLIEIDSAGKQSYFIRGADFVDGMEIVADTIYGVGSNRKVYAYDLTSKRQILNMKITGTSGNYLSSMVSDSAGCLLISCPYLNEIYKLRLSDHSCWVFAKGHGLNKPNGILLEKEKNRIVVIDDSPSPALIHAISLADSTITTLLSTTFNSPDGIVRDKYGYHYFGGYYLSGLYMTDAGFSYNPVRFFVGTNLVYPTYDPKDHSLLITLYEGNSWRRIPLTTNAVNTPEVAGDFTTYRVSPNPFSNGLTIKYDLNRRMDVRLEVYSASGVLLSTLVNQEQNPGSWMVGWNGLDHTGRQMSNGIYFVRMILGGSVQTQKALLIR